MNNSQEDLEYYFIDEQTGQEIIIDQDEWEIISSEDIITEDEINNSIKAENIIVNENPNNVKRLIFFLMLKLWWVILVCGLVSGIFSAIYTFYFMEPVYSATTKVLILKSKTNENINLADIEASAILNKDSIGIAKSKKVLQKAIDKLDYKKLYSILTLSKNVIVSSNVDTRILSITVEDGSVEMTAKLANAISESFVEVFDKYLTSVSDTDTHFSKIIEKASINNVPVRPNFTMNVLFAIVFGLLFGFAIIFLIETTDSRIKSPEKVAFISKLPLLGSIPLLELDDK